MRETWLVCSPFAGDVKENLKYAEKCWHDQRERDRAPYAPHLDITQRLDDNDPDAREEGMEIGLAWGLRADGAAFYVDRGISPGMKAEYRKLSSKIVVELRKFDGADEARPLTAKEWAAAHEEFWRG